MSDCRSKSEWISMLPACEYSNDGKRWDEWSWEIALKGFLPERDGAILEQIERRLRDGECLRVLAGARQRVRMAGSTAIGLGKLAVTKADRRRARKKMLDTFG